ncbi:hypothetical protein D3C74_298830 [compost metagenome]
MLSSLLRHLAIHFVLLFFAWKVRTIHIQKFRPEQTYTFSPVLDGLLQISDRADITGKPHSAAVLCNSFHRGQQLQDFLAAAQLLGNFSILIYDLLSGLKINDSFITINDQHIARLKRLCQLVLKTRDKRYSQSSRHNS